MKRITIRDPKIAFGVLENLFLCDLPLQQSLTPRLHYYLLTSNPVRNNARTLILRQAHTLNRSGAYTLHTLKVQEKLSSRVNIVHDFVYGFYSTLLIKCLHRPSWCRDPARSHTRASMPAAVSWGTAPSFRSVPSFPFASAHSLRRTMGQAIQMNIF